jgi:hypothetical protein
MEVEWGNRDQVLDDASKIAAVRATAKVMISGLRLAESTQLFIELEKLRRLAEDTAPWLCINLADGTDDPASTCKLLGADGQ